MKIDEKIDKKRDERTYAITGGVMEAHKQSGYRFLYYKRFINPYILQSVTSVKSDDNYEKKSFTLQEN